MFLGFKILVLLRTQKPLLIRSQHSFPANCKVVAHAKSVWVQSNRGWFFSRWQSQLTVGLMHTHWQYINTGGNSLFDKLCSWQSSYSTLGIHLHLIQQMDPQWLFNLHSHILTYNKLSSPWWPCCKAMSNGVLPICMKPQNSAISILHIMERITSLHHP